VPDIINCRDSYLLLRNSKGNEPQSTFSYIDVKKTNQTRKKLQQFYVRGWKAGFSYIRTRWPTTSCSKSWGNTTRLQKGSLVSSCAISKGVFSLLWTSIFHGQK
jgi:hypothetical protein